MASQTPGQSGSNLGIAPNLGAMLCYFFLCCFLNVIWAIVVVIVEKQSRLMRFHAFQSLLLSAVGFAAGVAVNILSLVVSIAIGGIMGLLVHLVWALVGLGFLAASIYMMIKAYGGEETSLPVIGDMARKWA